MTDNNLIEGEGLDQDNVPAKTCLIHALEPYAHDSEELKRLAAKFLPFALSCALLDSLCMEEIKEIVKTYPELVTTVLKCAKELRGDKSFTASAPYESREYKDFILSLTN